MSGRKVKQLGIIQRPYALLLCKAYRTTATSAAVVLSGLTPLHIRAETEAAYATVIHLKKEATFCGNTYSPVQYEHPRNPLETHPAHKGIYIRIHVSRSGEQITIQDPRYPMQYYTDGSKLDEGTGSAFVLYHGGCKEIEWKGHLQPINSTFQTEVIAITTAIQHAIDSRITDAMLFTDSMSTLFALVNHNHTSPLVADLENILQSHPQLI
ncbi:uncharacterized protein LOC118196946 [Stegodyphus dumicola]|uniref:uncharacterized protein LOC118196946 n=1 Tax=Stegodyphus dumicola TaxID=202533 RepID=UPI0015AA8F70|nr:uncharacterized protein LOC118196946 [Stegodyphus dumicola]